MEPRGTLDDRPVLQLLSSLADTRASGVLHVRGAPGSARVQFHRGLVRGARAERARCGDDDGAAAAFVGRRRKEFVSALLEIAPWTHVTWEWEPGRPLDGEPFVPMIHPGDLPAGA